jgi:hypothetical protein
MHRQAGAWEAHAWVGNGSEAKELQWGELRPVKSRDNYRGGWKDVQLGWLRTLPPT